MTSAGHRQRSPRARGVHRRRRGLGLVELLISLSIAAALLTAVGAAFSASAQAIEINDRFSRATQSGRVCLHHLLTEIRRSEYIDPGAGEYSANHVRVLTASGEERIYRYVPAAGTEPGKLMLETVDDPTDRDYVLARNVTESPFQVDTELDDLGQEYVSRVGVTIAIEVDGHTVRLSGSASPRKYLTYE